MAHFAKLDSENVVERVEVVSNAIATDEAAGVAFLQSLYGAETRWAQCSYNANIRKQFPGAGFKFDAAADVFVAPRPFASWSLDENHDWQPPVPMPGEGGPWFWNETAQAWEASP